MFYGFSYFSFAIKGNNRSFYLLKDDDPWIAHGAGRALILRKPSSNNE